jgi:hypothetical protein
MGSRFILILGERGFGNELLPKGDRGRLILQLATVKVLLMDSEIKEKMDQELFRGIII